MYRIWLLVISGHYANGWPERFYRASSLRFTFSYCHAVRGPPFPCDYPCVRKLYTEKFGVTWNRPVPTQSYQRLGAPSMRNTRQRYQGRHDVTLSVRQILTAFLFTSRCGQRRLLNALIHPGRKESSVLRGNEEVLPSSAHQRELHVICWVGNRQVLQLGHEMMPALMEPPK
jgi:hypothetical protein